ncbi:MAG: RICIN domain-containing protein [Faecalicoccus sp.]|uniref:RICIN domain-containing protein n=1 Tax=Faecalicoccus sp. TaxID=1971758 RepID=UPI002A91619C|nr:RICIN domain-containing protein [Faecalicoccus sp.]MDY5232846.1 RICIN domain-containing protein [Faecalicoccus sp.]
MKNIIRKGAALILFMAMVTNCFSALPIYAQEDNVNSGETITEIENFENNEEESISSEDVSLPEENENNIPEKDQITHDTQIQDNEVVEDKEEVSTPIPGDTSLVNYFYVGYPYLQAPASQEFVLSFGTGTENISRIVLKYQKDNGNLIELESSRQSEELYVFKKDFTESDKGTYKVIGFSYFVDSQEYTISFSDLEMDVRFGVNQEYDGYGENEGYTIDENGNEVEESNEINDSMAQAIESSVVSLDGSNVASTEDLVESVLKENVQTPQNNSRRKRSITTYSENNPLVICIDPGHGGSESGTVVVDGSLEKNMNLKIAMYLKEELEQYKNVKVVMTRTSDVYVSLQDRAKIAANAGATALVSIHINATGWGTQSSVSGAEVYYPHANYNAAVSETGKNLAQNILNELVGLGLNNLGIKVKYVYDTNTGEPAHDPAYDYPDGSVGDYYGVIRYSKELGVAGIIVEHAMSDNWNDFNNFLSSDAKLKNLGVADATGIAKAFGLSKISREDIDQLAQENKDILKDGTYVIQSRVNSKYVVDVTSASTENAANVQLYQQNYTDAQGWRVSHDTQGYVTFTNVNSGKVLDVDSARATNYQNVQQYASNGTYAQKWIVIKDGSSYKIVSALNSDYVLDLSAGIAKNEQNIQLYQSNNSVAQRWAFSSYKTFEDQMDKLAEQNKSLMDDGYYRIKSRGNLNYSLTVNVGSSNSNVFLYQNGEESQIWHLTHDKQGYVTLVNVLTGKALDVKDGVANNSQKVQQYIPNQSKAQKWIVKKDESGSLVILSGLNMDYVLDVSNAVYSNNSNVQLYIANGTNAQSWVFEKIDYDPSNQEYTIMGVSNITASNLVRYYNTYKGSTSYDKFSGDNSKYNGVLAKGGASTIEEFCQIYYEECLAEGVKPEVAFAQSMLETGFLKFGGDVLPNQYNFAGLGATGNGVHGNSFSSVRIGIRAHIQHLKCYASTAPLNQEKVDPRWSDSLRGKAPTVEKLQGTWATSTTYASSLLKAIERIKTI